MTYRVRGLLFPMATMAGQEYTPSITAQTLGEALEALARMVLLLEGEGWGLYRTDLDHTWGRSIYRFSKDLDVVEVSMIRVHEGRPT